MSTKAIACPFCNSVDLHTTPPYVACNSCGASGPERSKTKTDHIDHIELWNNRVSIKQETLNRVIGKLE